MATGELYVITIGTLLMLLLCAVSWATYKQLKLLEMLSLDLELVHPGITACIVQGQSAT